MAAKKKPGARGTGLWVGPAPRPPTVMRGAKPSCCEVDGPINELCRQGPAVSSTSWLEQRRSTSLVEFPYTISENVNRINMHTPLRLISINQFSRSPDHTALAYLLQCLPQ